MRSVGEPPLAPDPSSCYISSSPKGYAVGDGSKGLRNDTLLLGMDQVPAEPRLAKAEIVQEPSD